MIIDFHTHTFPDAIADKSRRIDSDGTGRRFSNRDDFKQLFIVDPFFVLDGFTLNKRNHCVTAAKGKQPDFHKYEPK